MDKIKENTAVMYLRYSSENQDENSIEYQRATIRAYAVSNGITVYGEYVDEAKTGTNDRRESFQRMISDAKNNPPWSKILVFDYSRYSRNARMARDFEEDLEDIGIKIISITQDFGNGVDGKLLKNICYIFNEYTSKSISKHTHAGMMQKAKSGLHCGGLPPLGYKVESKIVGYKGQSEPIEEKRLVVNNDEAKIVKMIFDMYEIGCSYQQMADRLNNLGYKTKTGKAFCKNSFYSILTQEKYTGTYTWNKAVKKNNKGERNSHKQKPIEEQIIVPNMIPIIIEKEQFDRVQEKMEERQKGRSVGSNKHFYLLGGMGKLTCAHCGSRLVGTVRNSRGRSYKYYYCPNHRHGGCPTKEIRAEYVEDFVIYSVVSDVYNRKDLLDVFNRTNDTDLIKSLKEKKKSLEIAIGNIISSLKVVRSEELLNELKKLSSEKAKINLQLEKYKCSGFELIEPKRKSFCHKLMRAMLDSENVEVKFYLREVIESINVSNDEIELILNIA